MAGRRGSTSSAVGLAAAFAALLSGVSAAQPVPQPPAPATQPPGSTLPDPGTPQVAPQPQPPGGPMTTAPDAPPTAPQASGPGGPLTPGGPPGSGFSGPINGPGIGSQPGIPQPPRFHFKIDPKTPAKELLPTPPRAKSVAGPLLTDDLTKVPEVEFQARPEKSAADPKLVERTAHQLAKINHLNAKQRDAFMTALLEQRDDLAGLPFAMGDDCRTSPERTRQFTIAVNTVRQALRGQQVVAFAFNNTGGFAGQMGGPPPQPVPPPPANVQGFWTQYAALCDQEDAARSKTDKALAEHVTLARLAALMQMLAPESAELRLGLVKYLGGVPHVEATKALAKMAIFSAEEEIRSAAIEALKVRREKDYTDVLVKGLRYPMPAVARRAAEAIALTGRADLVPELVAVLDETDPRLPATKEVGGKPVAVVREVVKVNHHRNCMMCHSPGNPETMSGSAIAAEVAVPGQPLPSPQEGYNRAQSSPDLMVRIDVTYLRQDFSAMLPVEDAHPWPELQRFDFLVRERKLTAEEAAAYREKLTPKEPGVVTPYHRAALAALRDITGKDAAPTADAWRKLLNLPTKSAAVKVTEGGKPRD